jgi:fumarate hydratase class II
MKTRTEKDSLEPKEVPRTRCTAFKPCAPWKIFPSAGGGFPGRSFGRFRLIKKCAAQVNMDLGFLDKKVGGAIPIGGGSGRREMGRPVSRGHFSDRVGDVHQHERQ